MFRLSFYHINNTIICKMKEDNKDNLEELWCHYSGMPSPLAYTLDKPKTPPCIGHDQETETLEDIDPIVPNN